MMNRSLTLAFAAAGAVLFAGLPAPSHAAPGPVLKPPAEITLVEEVGYYKRRWRRGSYVRAPFTEVDTRGDTYVRAPFARVYSGRSGTWVRAPFVNLWSPR